MDTQDILMIILQIAFVGLLIFALIKKNAKVAMILSSSVLIISLLMR